jgi:hypothetical protein
MGKAVWVVLAGVFACGQGESGKEKAKSPEPVAEVAEVAASKAARDELGVETWAIAMGADRTSVEGRSAAGDVMTSFERTNESGTETYVLRRGDVTSRFVLSRSDDTTELEMVDNSVPTDGERTLEILNGDLAPSEEPNVTPRTFGQVQPQDALITDCADLIKKECAGKEQSYAQAQANTAYECQGCRGGLLSLTCGDCNKAKSNEEGWKHSVINCRELTLQHSCSH